MLGKLATNNRINNSLRKEKEEEDKREEKAERGCIEGYLGIHRLSWQTRKQRNAQAHCGWKLAFLASSLPLPQMPEVFRHLQCLGHEARNFFSSRVTPSLLALAPLFTLHGKKLKSAGNPCRLATSTSNAFNEIETRSCSVKVHIRDAEAAWYPVEWKQGESSDLAQLQLRSFPLPVRYLHPEWDWGRDRTNRWHVCVLSKIVPWDKGVHKGNLRLLV